MKRLKNEKGFAAVLTVSVLSIVLVTSLLTVYVYTVNRTRHYAKIKEAYKLIGVMEDAGKAIRSGWDSAASVAANDIHSCCKPVSPGPANSSAGPPPGYGNHSCVSIGGVQAWGPLTKGCIQDIAFTMQSQMTSGSCSSLPLPACCSSCVYGAIVPDICFDNPDNSTKPYCFYGLKSDQTVQFRMGTPDQFLNPNLLEKFVAKLDGFFEGDSVNQKVRHTDVALSAPAVWSWAFNEARALAVTPQATGPCCTGGPPENTINVPALPACTYGGTNTNGCMTCGASTLRQCVYIFSCPLSFTQQCNTWAPVANGTGALFAQEFVLSPPGVCSANTDATVCF